ncbi:EamA family transporter [Occultella kanbiaonis]|uniref:EamA family transporter n=1 Tax=Occultella kanbiaonis TaxID=2675754 RepID=UPI0012B76B74|nr:EamA family transporter [Occultella kanbiaonis]
MRQLVDRTPAPLLFLVGGFSQYIGAALAVGLYPTMPPHAVAWLRAVFAAVVLLLVVRPWRADWNRRTLTQTGVFGLVLLGMNMLFYVAIEHLPLGAAVAVEFTGPVAVAAWGGRTARARIAIGLALFGVLSISLVGLDWSVTGSTADLLLGLAAALAAGVLWAAYMVIGGRIVRARDGLSSLAVGLTIAAVAFAPFSAPFAGAAVRPEILVTAAAVGVLSSVVPYVLDQVTLKRLGTATFALMNALLPVSATIIGVIALAQLPTAGEVVGVLAVSAAVWISGSGRRPAVEPG